MTQQEYLKNLGESLSSGRIDEESYYAAVANADAFVDSPNNKSKDVYYFTFGGSDKFQFKGGYVAVIATDLQQAIKLFRECYPDVTDGIVNCSDYYTSSEFDNYLINCSRTDDYWTKLHNVLYENSIPVGAAGDIVKKYIESNYDGGSFKDDIAINLYQFLGADVVDNVLKSYANAFQLDSRLSDDFKDWASESNFKKPGLLGNIHPLEVQILFNKAILSILSLLCYHFCVSFSSLKLIFYIFLKIKIEIMY